MKRLRWVDVAKGIAMCLVMIGHVHKDSALKTWLYLFHIPLFFFLSGYVFSINKYSSLSEFLRSKVRSLLLPMVTMGLISQIIGWLLSPDISFLRFLLQRLIGIFIQLRGSGYDLGLWFFSCLFLVELIMYMLIRLTKNSAKHLFILTVTVSCIGFVYVRLVNRICPWSVEEACIATLWFGLGYLLKSLHNESMVCFNAPLFIICILVTVVLAGLFEQNNIMTDMYANKIPALPLYLLGAFSGIIFAVQLSLLFDRINALIYVGQNTIVYYAFHTKAFQLFDRFIAPDLIINKTVRVGMMGMKVLFAMSLCAGISCLINKYCPYLIGKKRPEKKVLQ